jgi:hypothetical protein
MFTMEIPCGKYFWAQVTFLGVGIARAGRGLRRAGLLRGVWARRGRRPELHAGARRRSAYAYK